MDHKEAVKILVANSICGDSAHFNGCFECPFFNYKNDDCSTLKNNDTVFEAVKFLQGEQ